jgi:hypothetical protein
MFKTEGTEEVPNDHEHDQTEGNDRTGGSVSAGQTAALTATAGVRPTGTASRKVHVSEHETTVARVTEGVEG